jgi:hypothetical protein
MTGAPLTTPNPSFFVLRKPGRTMKQPRFSEENVGAIEHSLYIGRGYQPQVRYSWMESAAFRTAPMAKISMAALVTMPPPTQTLCLLVLPVSGSPVI